MASKISNSVQEFYKDKTIFITGGSGFMGKVLIEKLLYSCSALKQIIILMRSKRGKTQQMRIKEFEALPVSNFLEIICNIRDFLDPPTPCHNIWMVFWSKTIQCHQFLDPSYPLMRYEVCKRALTQKNDFLDPPPLCYNIFRYFSWTPLECHIFLDPSFTYFTNGPTKKADLVFSYPISP